MTRKKNWFFDFQSTNSKKVYLFHLSSDGLRKRVTLAKRDQEPSLPGAVMKLVEFSGSSDSTNKCQFPIGVRLQFPH